MNLEPLLMKWRQWREQIAEMSDRERTLIFVGSVVSLFLILFNFWIDPAGVALQNERARLVRMESDLTQITSTNQLKKAKLAVPPNTGLDKELRGLELELTKMDAQLREQMVDLITAEQMPVVLQSMLANTEQLKIIELTTDEAVPLLPADAVNNLYRHQIRLVLEGRYRDLYRYLNGLESQQGRFYWRKLDYKVTQYPNARIELLLYTLGNNKEFIRG